MVTNVNEDPKEYILFRAENGLPYCHFVLGDDYEFLKSTTAPNLHATNITGILDKKT